MEDKGKPTPADDARRLYEHAEARTAKAMEGLVGREAFGELLARVAENVLALMKIGNDAADLVVRNLRVAGRRDITGLARQLARTEDKLELVLQEVERLRDAVDGVVRDGAGPAAADGAPGRAESARAAGAARRASGSSSRAASAARRAAAAPRKGAEPQS
jgi:hypothetical protein